MKTIIFSLTVLLAFLSGSASAQRMNGYNSNANASNHHGNYSNGGVIIDNTHSEYFKTNAWSNRPSFNVVPQKTNAVYHLPAGMLPKPAIIGTKSMRNIARSKCKYNSKEWAIILPTQ